MFFHPLRPQPYIAQYVKPVLDSLITLPAKLTLEHAILTAILVVLIGMWRTQCELWESTHTTCKSLVILCSAFI